MSEEDMSNIIQQLNNMMNNSTNISSSNNNFEFNNVQKLLSNESSQTNKSNFNNNFNLDFDTIMKIKTLLDKFNSYNNSPDTNLLLSLKPYLSNSKKNKIEQYIQILKIAKLFENFDFNGDVKIK